MFCDRLPCSGIRAATLGIEPGGDAVKYTPQCTNPGWTGQIFKPDPPDVGTGQSSKPYGYPESIHLRAKPECDDPGGCRGPNDPGLYLLPVHAAMMMTMTMMILF